MKKLILTLFIFALLGTSGYAQGDRIFQKDSLKSGRTAVSFTIATKHNFNTFTVKSITSGDSITVFNVNEAGDTTPVSIRDLNTYMDVNSNLITGVTGNREYLVLNPNIYKLLIKCTATDIASKTLYIRRRGNNLK